MDKEKIIEEYEEVILAKAKAEKEVEDLRVKAEKRNIEMMELSFELCQINKDRERERIEQAIDTDKKFMEVLMDAKKAELLYWETMRLEKVPPR